VHTFPSSQLSASPPTHRPALHVSWVVQALPSSHGAVLLACRQPRARSQESVVHTFPSLQLGGDPPTQLPFPSQVSWVVQALPSSHGAVLFVRTQPLAGLQESVVQTFPSLQLGGGPPRQCPAPSQVSPVVHALPSLQGAVLFVCTQPLAGLQESVVQTFPSLQLGGGPPRQCPAPGTNLQVGFPGGSPP